MFTLSFHISTVNINKNLLQQSVNLEIDCADVTFSILILAFLIGRDHKPTFGHGETNGAIILTPNANFAQ